MRIVADSSPLIAFSILDHLDLLPQLFSEICIPQAVNAEVTTWGKPHSQKLRKFLKDKVQTVQNEVAVGLLKNDVGLGEAEVIILALENGIGNVFIDDHKGRKIAQTQGLNLVGSIGVLLQAKRMELIKELKPNLDKLIANKIRIGKNLYQRALKLANEK